MYWGQWITSDLHYNLFSLLHMSGTQFTSYCPCLFRRSVAVNRFVRLESRFRSAQSRFARLTFEALAVLSIPFAFCRVVTLVTVSLCASKVGRNPNPFIEFSLKQTISKYLILLWTNSMEHSPSSESESSSVGIEIRRILTNVIRLC